MPDQRLAWFEEIKADAVAVIATVEDRGFKFFEYHPDGSRRDMTDEVLAKQKLNVERMDKIISLSKPVPGSSGPLDVPNFGAV